MYIEIHAYALCAPTDAGPRGIWRWAAFDRYGEEIGERSGIVDLPDDHSPTGVSLQALLEAVTWALINFPGARVRLLSDSQAIVRQVNERCGSSSALVPEVETLRNLLGHRWRVELDAVEFLI